LRKYLPDNLWPLVIAPIVVLLAGAGIGAAVSALNAEAPTQTIRSLEPVVHNGPAESEEVAMQGSHLLATRQTDKSKARVEIRLENAGARRTYITSAIFTVEKVIEVPSCRNGASIAVSAHYDVLLPGSAGGGEKLEVPVNQQIAPDGVDRFVFRVGQRSGGSELDTVIYQLGISVSHDGASEPVEVGQVLLALPGSPTRQDLYLGSPSARHGCGPEALEAFQAAAQLDGVRSRQFGAVLTAARVAE
jgi:hypothetical protein